MSRPFQIGDRVRIRSSHPSEADRYGLIEDEWMECADYHLGWHVKLDPQPSDDPTLLCIFNTDDLKHVSPLIQLAECAD